MKSYNITHLILSDTTGFNYAFPIRLENGTTVNLFDSDDFKRIIKNQYTSFRLLSPGYYDPDQEEWVDIIPDTDAAIQELHELYRIFIKDRAIPISKLFDALRKKYNPIWNVDGVTGTIRKESHTGTDTDKKSGTDKIHDTLGSGTITNSGSSKNVRTGSETAADTGTDTTTEQKTTFDSATYRDTDKTSLLHGRSTTTTYNNLTDTYTVDPTNKLTTENDMEGDHDTTYDSELKKTLNLQDDYLEMEIRQGNIGVTSTQSLILQQLNLTELDDIITYVIHDFVHRYLVLM